MSARRELALWIGGRRAGVVFGARRGRITLRYDSQWRDDDRAIPLSVALPLSAAEHRHEAVAPWLWGLLPDATATTQAWARSFGVADDDLLGLLAHVGEDCPGAVQFVQLEREHVLLGPDEQPRWVEDAEVAARLRALRVDGAAWRRPHDVGWFSLAGAQPKTALLWHQGRWAIPSGRVPTTHILKPSLPALRHHAINEHLCLGLAREVGLAAARSEVRRFEDEVAIVVERFDRVSAESPLAVGIDPYPIRIHQEDFCQALAVMPGAKYQAQGGPSARDVVGVLRRHGSRPAADIAAFLDALAFQWLIGGSDGHAKNYAMLHGSAGAVRLAPLYDLASIFAYPELLAHRPRLAMKVGGSYEPRKLGATHWRRLAEEAEVEPTALVLRVVELAEALVPATTRVAERARSVGLDAGAVDAVVAPIARWSARCARVLARPGGLAGGDGGG